jgi:hypothetical protein
MSLQGLQIVFNDLTVGRIDVSTIERTRSTEDALSLGYALTEHDIHLLRSIDWHVARCGLDAHRRIGEVLARTRYLRDPATGRFTGANYPFPNPRLRREDNMSDERNPPGAKTEQAALGDVSQPVQYPPPGQPVAVDPYMFQAAAVRCAPAIDPSVYQERYHAAPVTTVLMRGAVLKGADLSNQDFRGADLVGADLTDADLTNADLRGANLAGAILQGAKLNGVKWK